VLGAHLRRSFLGAMGPGASPAARAGKPCDWHPPCALDIFCREQIRSDRGLGLPKPYVIEVTPGADTLRVTLRVFGLAGYWFPAAAEAMVAGITTILPWARLSGSNMAPPRIAARRMLRDPLPPAPAGCQRLRLALTAPLDVTSSRPAAAAGKVAGPFLPQLLRRVSELSRWNGVTLAPDAARVLALRLREVAEDTAALKPGTHFSPNAKGQRRRRQVLRGEMRLRGDIASIWPLLAMGMRCHLGRGAVEGLGAFRLIPEG